MKISSKAPWFLRILTKIACHSDSRNKKKVNKAHYPGICSDPERNREMCGLQSLVSLLLFSARVPKLVCVCVCVCVLRVTPLPLIQSCITLEFCVGYTATVKLVEDVGQLFTAPLDKWIADNVNWGGGGGGGGNLDHKRSVRDVRSDDQGSMYSMIAGRSRTPALELPRTGQVAPLYSIASDFFLQTLKQ